MSGAWLSAPADAKISRLLPAASSSCRCRGSPAPRLLALLQTPLLALPGCSEHGGAQTSATCPLAKGKEFLNRMHAPLSFWLKQYLAVVPMGITTWQEKLRWIKAKRVGAEAGRGRSNVSKRRKCYGEPNETAGRGLLHVPGIWPSTDFTFVLWREIKTLVHSAHGPKNFGNKPSCCPLLEPALLLQGRFAIQRQLGKSERKKLNLLSVFWRPSS